MGAKSAKELRVYQQAYALAMEIFDLSKAWPKEGTKLISSANSPMPMLRTVKWKPGLILPWIANI